MSTSNKRDEPKVVHVETKKVDNFWTNYEATVVLDNGKTASATAVYKENAVKYADEKARRK